MLVVLAASGAILLRFHDRFWYAPDDGTYAHIASRILHGEILNRDVQDIHAGYIHFVNALAFAVFGEELLSLRYPLVAATLIQACLIFLLLQRAGLLVAACTAIGVTALSFIQFLDPTAHWYCFFLVVVLIGVLTWLPPGSRGRVETLGFLVAAIGLFRQLSGVLVLAAAATFLLHEASAVARSRQRGAAVFVVAFLTVGFAGYGLLVGEPFGLFLFGTWPFAILLWALLRVRVDNAQVGRVLGRFSAGAAIAALPLLSYHAWHASFATWIDDIVITAMRVPRMDFIDMPGYLALVVAAVRSVTYDSAAVPNGIFWLALLLLAPLNGFKVVQSLMRGKAVAPLPFIASFYALVSIHYQIPIYLFYSAGISLAALVSWGRGDEAPTGHRWTVVAVVVGLSGVALHYHAGQPVSRGWHGIVSGRRLEEPVACGIPRCGLRLQAEDVTLYARLVELTDRFVAPDETILALPANPEIYFLSGRPSAVRFFNSALGIRNDSELEALLRELQRRPPKLIFFRPENKYNTEYSDVLLEQLKATHELVERRGGFEVYALSVHADA
jgi:hypothetical protein